MSRLVWILINSLHSRFCDLWPGYIWPWKWSILLFITWNSERETDWPLWLPVSWCIAHHHHHHHHHHHLTGFCPKSSVLSTLAPRLIRVSQAACIPAIAARWRGVCFFWKSYLSQRKIFVSENSEYFVKYWYHLVEGGLLLLHIILLSEIQLSFFVTLDSSNFQSSEEFYSWAISYLPHLSAHVCS